MIVDCLLTNNECVCVQPSDLTEFVLRELTSGGCWQVSEKRVYTCTRVMCVCAL